MSGLLERIVRRRRASASRRLGPPSSSDGAAEENGRPEVNGTATAESAILALQSVQPPIAQAETAAATEPAVPTSSEPSAEPATPGEPGFRERGRMRRRARYLRQLREVQLRDIGGFVLELHRFDQQRPELVNEKVAGAARTDAELRGLERALELQHTLRELRQAGIGGACSACGAVYGSEDRFCASCGEPLRDEDTPDLQDPLDHGQVYPE